MKEPEYKKYLKDCKKCGEYESIKIIVSSISLSGFSLLVNPCESCNHQHQVEQFLNEDLLEP